MRRRGLSSVDRQPGPDIGTRGLAMLTASTAWPARTDWPREIRNAAPPCCQVVLDDTERFCPGRLECVAQIQKGSRVCGSVHARSARRNEPAASPSCRADLRLSGLPWAAVGSGSPTTPLNSVSPRAGIYARQRHEARPDFARTAGAGGFAPVLRLPTACPRCRWAACGSRVNDADPLFAGTPTRRPQCSAKAAALVRAHPRA